MGSLTASLVPIKDFGSVVATPRRRFVAANYLNKVIVAQPDVAPVTWNALSTSTNPLPGLPVGQNYRGVNAFQGFLVVWSGFTLKWSDQNDFTLWIPVAVTVSSFAFELGQAFTLGAVGIESSYLYVTENPAGLTAGQYLRIDADPQFTFLKVVAVLPTVGEDGVLSGFTQTVPAGGSQDIFIQAFVPYVTDARLYFAGTPSIQLEVQSDAVQPAAVALVLASAFTNPSVGSSVTAEFTTSPGTLAPLSYVSISQYGVAGNDVFQVISVSEATNEATLKRMGVAATGATGHNAGELVVAQPFVSVKNLSASTGTTSSFIEPLKESYGFTVIPQDLTGAATVGTVFAAGQQILTVDANGAGEAQNTGAGINGPIAHFDTIGDSGVIFKRRSIQSVQFVGEANGTFFIRPEITDEGLVGDYSFVKVGEDQIYIWGNRGIYRYLGGKTLESIAEQHYKQLKAELDLTRADEIVGYHNEDDFEIWFIYPRIDQPSNYNSQTRGSLRIFIYNYKENSVAIDDYPNSVGAVSAAGRLDWNTDLAWSQVQGTWAVPISFSTLTTWSDESSDTSPSLNILGIAQNSPPFVPTMTMRDAMNLYNGAHVVSNPLGTVYTDPLKFLVALNSYWQANGTWPSLFVIGNTGDGYMADVQILKAFGYTAGSGIAAYFLGTTPSATPGLVCYGNGVTDRNADPILCQYESVDFGGEDPMAFKYIDTQVFSLQVRSKRSVSMPLLVYIGFKANYDDDVVWSDPIVLYVQGNRNYTTKTNVKASGRYFRMRLQAVTPGLEFRVSQCQILGRLGGTY